MSNRIEKLLKNLCCSTCKSDFNEDSIEIIRKEKEVSVIKLECKNCGKSFGVAFLKMNDSDTSDDDIALKFSENTPEKYEGLDLNKFISFQDYENKFFK